MIRQIVHENHPAGLDKSSDQIFPGFLEHDGICCVKEELHLTFETLAYDIANLFRPKRILELGSGAGSLSWWIRNLCTNTVYVSVDINRKAAYSPWYRGNNAYHFIARTDEPLHFVDDNDQTVIFDLILSFEHFEHISPETFGVFLDNIKKHSDKNTIVVGTASKLYEPGSKVHINHKTEEEWIKCISDKGFRMLNLNFLTIKNRPFNFTPGLDTIPLIFIPA